VYSCTIVLASTFDEVYGGDRPAIEFEEYNEGGTLAADEGATPEPSALDPRGGDLNALRARIDDEWVHQVVAALDRERAHRGADGPVSPRGLQGFGDARSRIVEAQSRVDQFVRARLAPDGRCSWHRRQAADPRSRGSSSTRWTR